MDTENEIHRRPFRCADGFCGALDCERCYPGNNYSDTEEDVNKARDVFLSIRNAGLVLLLAFCSLADYGDAQLIDEGRFPVYQKPPAFSGVPGPTVILMPDGGTWTINPPSVPDHVPAPYYNLPDHANDSCRPRLLHERSPRYGN